MRVPEDDHGVRARYTQLELAIAVDHSRAHDGWITTNGCDASLEVERIDNRPAMRLRRRRQKQRRERGRTGCNEPGSTRSCNRPHRCSHESPFGNRSTPSGEGVALLD